MISEKKNKKGQQGFKEVLKPEGSFYHKIASSHNQKSCFSTGKPINLEKRSPIEQPDARFPPVEQIFQSIPNAVKILFAKQRPNELIIEDQEQSENK